MSCRCLCVLMVLLCDLAGPSMKMKVLARDDIPRAVVANPRVRLE